MTAWQEHVERWKECQKCPLAEQRYRICIARGNIPCDVLFIGEAPGASEDARGLPFHGPAGHVLDQIIERALPPDVSYALTNLVCCFPREAKERGENEPERDEILACRPRLVEFVNICQPRLIICVGSLATQYIDRNDTVPCVNIIHPAATFPGRMPRAQADYVIQRTIVILRSAMEKVLERSRTEWKPWGQHMIPQAQGLRQRMDTWEKDNADFNIPF